MEKLTFRFQAMVIDSERKTKTYILRATDLKDAKQIANNAFKQKTNIVIVANCKEQF